MRPDEFINSDVPVCRDCLFVLYAISDHQHLYSNSRTTSNAARVAVNTHLAYIRHFEHLFIVERLLRFNNARQIDQLERIQRIGDVKDTPSRVYHLVGFDDTDAPHESFDVPLNLNQTSVPISLA